jgi:hypothetical protein
MNNVDESISRGKDEFLKVFGKQLIEWKFGSGTFNPKYDESMYIKRKEV